MSSGQEEEEPKRKMERSASQLGDLPPLETSALLGAAAGTAEPKRRKSSRKRKDKFSTKPKRSVSFEEPPVAEEIEISRPPSTVPEEREQQPQQPQQLQQPPPFPPHPAPGLDAQTAERDRSMALARQQSAAEKLTLPPSRPGSAASSIDMHSAATASVAAAATEVEEQRAEPTLQRKASGHTFDVFGGGAGGKTAAQPARPARPKTATGLPSLPVPSAHGSGGGSEESMSVATATAARATRPKTAAARVPEHLPAAAESRDPSHVAAASDSSAAAANAATTAASPSSKQLHTPAKRKVSMKKLSSRMRMFPGSPGAHSAAAPDWSAYEGSEDNVSIRNLKMPIMLQDDSLAAELMESAEEEEYDEDEGKSEGEEEVDVPFTNFDESAVFRDDRGKRVEPQAAARGKSTRVFTFGASTTGATTASAEAEGEQVAAVKKSKAGLFHKAKQDKRLGQIYSLAGELQHEDSDEDTDAFLAEFGRSVKDELLAVGTMSVDDLQEEERRIRADQITLEEHAAKQHTDRQQELTNLELEAKRTVYDRLASKRKDLQDQQKFMLDCEMEKVSELQRAYSRAETQLKSALGERKAEVTTLYGDLQLADDGQYSGSRQRRWKLEWRHTPQPIEIKLKLCRGVKDKLPAGRYVMLVSLFDRLGGHILRWSNLAGQQWGGVTLPVQHRGRFHDLEMEIDQSVSTVCPSRSNIKPGMVLLFELFILRGAVVPTDRVVAWGTFPICDADFNVVEGRYKCALLRGERDPTIDRHSRMEEIMAKDLDSWLCNLYFEILKLPRYLAGQKEYEVELQFSSAMLGFPDRLHDDVPVVDGNDPIVQSQEDIVAALNRGQEDTVDEGDSLAGSTASLLEDRRPTTVASRRGMSHHHGDAHRGTGAGQTRSSGTRKRGTASAKDAAAAAKRPGTVHFSRKLFDKRTDSSSEEDTDSGIDGFKEDPNDRGLYYRVHSTAFGEDRERQVYTMLPTTPLLKQKKKERANRSKAEELKLHTIAVHPPFSVEAKSEHKAGKKWSYVRRQFLSEVGLSQWRSRDFWAVLLMLVIAFWIRIYTHYIGQWIFLTALLIPINKFDFLWISVNLNYQPTLLYTRQEMAVVFMGPTANIVLFALFVALAYVSLKVFNSFPHIVSRFILSFGVMTVLDPLFIVLVDLAYGRYVQAIGSNPLPIGDAFKLYFHFSRIEGTGVAGVFLTLFCYLVTVAISLTLLYIYFLRLHLNGRMMDVYHRLNGKEDDFFIPFDLELSNEEISWVCRKAEQWRGEEGERRKVAVYDYVWEEAQDSEDDDTSSVSSQTASLIAKKKRKSKAKEITTHVSVHTLHLDGLRELYRHFLRLPDGAIVEVIGEMGLVGMETRIRTALQSAGAGRGRLLTSASPPSLSLQNPKGGIGTMDDALLQKPLTRHSKRGDGHSAIPTGTDTASNRSFLENERHV